VCVNSAWLPFITGALEVLALPDYWEDPDTALPEVDNLIAAFNEPGVVDCSGVVFGTCVAFPFTDATGGWVAADGYSVSWTSGFGFAGGDPSNYDQVYIKLEFGGSFHLLRVQVILSAGIAGDAAGVICPGYAYPACSEPLIHVPVPSSFSLDTDVTTSVICLGCERATGDTSFWGYIEQVILTFSGPAPDLGVPCP
jgi:hypothetical protein